MSRRSLGASTALHLVALAAAAVLPAHALATALGEPGESPRAVVTFVARAAGPPPAEPEVPSLREVEAPDVSDALERLELVETPPVPRPEPDPPRLERPLAEPARPSFARVLPREPEPVPAPVEPEATGPTEAEADDDRDASAAEPAVQRVAAVLIEAVEPSYPRLARRMGWEGSVVCRLAIDSDGAVSTVSVDRSSGRDVLDEAAVSALRRWRFRPATADGDRVPSELRHTVTFRLAVR